MNNHNNTNEQFEKDLLETTFNDIFNIEEIQRLQDLFADAHEVASIITNIDGRPITKPSNFTYFCENIIRKTDKGCVNCYKSDAVLGRYNPKSANVQQCLSSGLWDAGVSITVGGKHIGNWLIGQVRNENIDENKLIEYADEIGVDRAKFKAALLDVPIMSEKKFRKIANLLFVIANELSEKAYSNILLKNQIIESNLAQNALLEAEWKFKALFDLGPIGVAYHRMIYDADGKPFDYYFIDANHSYNALTGVSPKGMTVRQAFPGIENDPSDWIGMFGRVAKTGETIHFEQYLESNGRWYDCVGYQYKPDHFVAAFNEITKRKEAEIALKESEVRFKNFFNNSVVGKTITSIDGKLNANNAFCKMIGYTEDELNKLNWREITYKDDIEPNEKYVAGILRGEVQSKHWEKRYIHKDGHIVWVDINTYLQRDDNGKPLYFITALIDITDKKKAEESLMQSEEELRNLIELSPVAMSIIHEWKTVYFNPAAIKLFGAKSQEELINKHIYNFIHQDYKELALENSKILAENGYIPIHEEKYIKLDGTVLDVETQAKSIRYNDEPATLIVMNDITERKLNEYKTQLNAKRLNALVDVLQYSTDSIQDYLDYTLTKIIEITESKIGYIYHYYEDRKEFVLNTWSREVMKECKVQEQKTVYQLEKTGLWGEAVRQRKPIMVNDFQAPHPLKKGQPEGHAPLYRYLTIPVFSKNEIVGVVAVANKDTDYVQDDITQLTILMEIVWKSLERKKAELDLIESEEKYRILLENSGIGIGVYDLDGKVLMFNQKALQNLGGNKEDYIGKTLVEIFGEEVGLVYLKRIQDTAKSEISLEFEDNFHSESGDYWFLSNHTRIKNSNDEIIGVQVLSHDITERKIAQEKIAESEKILFKSQQVAQLGSYMWDITKGYWTSSAILDNIFGIDKNYNRSTQGWLDLIHPDWQAIMSDYITNDIILKHQRFDKEYKIIRKDNGQECWVHGLGDLEFDSSNNPIKLFGTISNINQRKNAEEALIKKNADLDYMNKFMVNREVRMADMKKEINDLLEKMGEKKRYL